MTDPIRTQPAAARLIDNRHVFLIDPADPELVERAAKAIYYLRWRGGITWEAATRQAKAPCRNYARAAIKAILS